LSRITKDTIKNINAIMLISNLKIFIERTKANQIRTKFLYFKNLNGNDVIDDSHKGEFIQNATANAACGVGLNKTN